MMPPHGHRESDRANHWYQHYRQRDVINATEKSADLQITGTSNHPQAPQ